ncbi:MAG: hypothetical protein KTR33_09745 [Gammaproteobacteria bacterium]|nr:hypothetical protein [Gammaproteobacteria bacterium]
MKILIGLEPRCLHTSMPWILARQFQAAGAELHWVFGGETRIADHYTTNGDHLSYPTDKQHQTHAGKILFQAGGSTLGWISFAARLLRLKPVDYDLVLVQHGTAMARLFQLRQFRIVTLGSWIGDTRADSLSLPPIIDTHLRAHNVESPYTLVYLPGKSIQDIEAMLERVEGRKFIVYSHDGQTRDHPNISFRTFEHARFRQDLCGASAVICRAEFGLVAECLHMGIPLLVEPGQGKREQQETATALHKSGLVHSSRRLTPMLISLWLDSTPRPAALRWPDVPQMIVDCVKDSSRAYESLHHSSVSLWDSLPIQLDEK